MKRLIFAFLILWVLPLPGSALELTVPTVPEDSYVYMPNPEEDFGAGIWSILKKAVKDVSPDLREASRVCLGVGSCVALVAVFRFLPGGSGRVTELAGTAAISLLLMSGTGSLIRLADHTVTEISEYAKLFFPVLTTAMAAQGRGGSSAALYSGTIICNTLLSTLVSGVLIPGVYLYLALAIGAGMTDQEILSKILDGIKSVIVWGLKMILYGFTGFMAITGVISGSADATALKLTKLTISSMVPVVGGILSNASEAVLIGAATAKHAAGIYGMFAFVAMWIRPFLKIGAHYLLLKITGAVSSVFDCKKAAALLEHFCGAMGLLLAMTGTVCMMLIISITCFLKGVG